MTTLLDTVREAFELDLDPGELLPLVEQRFPGATRAEIIDAIQQRLSQIDHAKRIADEWHRRETERLD